MKYILKCQFCDKPVGEIDLPEGQTFDEKMFADIRCDDCEKKYGNYHEMEVEAEQKLRGLVKDEELHDKVVSFLEEANFKKSDLDEKINAFVEEKIKTEEK